MSKMLPVQKDWPLPPIDRSASRRRRKYPIETTDVGAMFFVEGRTVKSVVAYISRISKDVSQKFSARHCWATKRPDGTWAEAERDAPKAVEGVGVWRIE